MTLTRIVLVVIGIWFTLTVVGYILFNLGGTVPGKGRGDPVGLSAQ